MRILVSGSLAYDNIMDFPDYFKNHILPNKIHDLNVSFLVDNLKINYGGTAGNIAYNLALLGEKPVIFSTAGHDFLKYQKWLKSNRVDLSGVKMIKNELTPMAHVITDLGDNQITAFYPGAMKYPGPEIKKSYLKNTLAIVAPGAKKSMIDYLKVFKKNKVPYLFDPGQQIPAFTAQELKEGISGAKIFISNDYELNMVMKKTGWTENDILNKVEILVTTLGERGSVIKTKKEKIVVTSAKPKAVKDPTGAGDAYRAGFIKGLVNHLPLKQCGQLASIVAVYAVETYGTQEHRFTWEGVKKRYKSNFKESL